MCSHSPAGIDAREGVEREDAFRALVVSVDREGDALLEEEQLEAAELLTEFLVAEAGELVGDAAVVRDGSCPCASTSSSKRSAPL
jgi:hypothetical protein